MYALPFIAFPLLFVVVIVVSIIFAVINHNDRRDDKKRQQRDKAVDVDADATVRSWIGQLQAPLPSQSQSSLASPTPAPQKSIDVPTTTLQTPTVTPTSPEAALSFDDLDTPAVFRSGTATSQKWKSLSKLGNKEFDAALAAEHKERLAKASKARAAKSRRAKAVEQKIAHDAADDAAYQEEAGRDPALLDEIERLQASISRDNAGHAHD